MRSKPRVDKKEAKRVFRSIVENLELWTSRDKIQRDAIRTWFSLLKDMNAWYHLMLAKKRLNDYLKRNRCDGSRGPPPDFARLYRNAKRREQRRWAKQTIGKESP